MFTEEGYWKEFGFDSALRTPFPFWAFIVFYALLSFLAAKMIIRPETIIAANLAMATGVGHNEADAVAKAVVPKRRKKEIEEGDSVPLTQTMKPGYYKLNSKQSVRSGAPRYIYLGSTPPSDSESDSE